MALRSTRADLVREALADDIISGRVPAGTRLDEASLAKRFAVSRTPVREALRELATTGLVRSKAHQGARRRSAPGRGSPRRAACPPARGRR